MSGPLNGYRIVEIAGIGPGPFAAMMLADMGAEVVRVERAQAVAGHSPDRPHWDVMLRGRRNIAVDLKSVAGVSVVLDLVERADALIEGFRPGVMERLGVGPDQCLARNPKLVYGRMTGWGQDGPFRLLAGHDINYISIAGVLAHLARDGERPVPPMNLVGDFGGGGMLLAYGVVCALLEAQRSGQGQVVDAAMIDGAAVLTTQFWGGIAAGTFDVERPGTNLIDTGAHFYDVYRCKDGRDVSIGSFEPEFYIELLQLTGLADDPEFGRQLDRELWPILKTRFAQLFATKTRDEWCRILEGTNACFSPVLTMIEAAQHPHNIARNLFVEFAGVRQPAPAPRFSRSSPELSRPPAHPGEHTREVLVDWGFDKSSIDELLASKAVVASYATMG